MYRFWNVFLPKVYDCISILIQKIETTTILEVDKINVSVAAMRVVLRAVLPGVAMRAIVKVIVRVVLKAVTCSESNSQSSAMSSN